MANFSANGKAWDLLDSLLDNGNCFKNMTWTIENFSTM